MSIILDMETATEGTLKFKPGNLVSFYDPRSGQSWRGRVTDASRDHVAVKLYDGRTLRFDDAEAISHLSRVRYRR